MEEKSDKSDCTEFYKCLTILNLMLDGEANEEEESYFKLHMESCMICFEHMKVETEIRKLIKSKIQKQPVPEDLERDIRVKIQTISQS
ncbi:MAG: anti-sigma factor [Cyclobacteriaceae bacterium]|nr:anti-sigma factor [Cyclobacteriaceae bacterium HetDA_MAG_MS6]